MQIQQDSLNDVLAFVDSLFYTLHQPGPGDIYIRDSILQNKYGFQKHDYIKSIAYLDSMMEVVKDRTTEEKYAERYAIILYEKAEYFYKMRRYNEAFLYVSQAEKTVHELVKNKCNVIKYRGKIGYLMFAQEKYQESALAFKEQFNALSACSADTYSLQRCLNNIALSYLKIDELDSALKYEEAALVIIHLDEIKEPSKASTTSVYCKAVVYGDQAEVFARRGNFDAAENLYKKSIEGTLPFDTGYAQATQARLADIYLKKNNTTAAWTVLNQIKASFNTFQNEQQLLMWHKLMVKYYMQTNNAAAALIHQQQFENLNDSISLRDKKFVNTDLGKEFENLELKYSNEVLEKENKLKTLYIGIALVVFIMSITMAWMVWRNLKRTKQLNKQVQHKNDDLKITLATLEQSHRENNRIIRIVAHDLKNPISAVNNLVYSLLKKNHPEDLTEILTLIKTACASSMSLIKEVLNENKSNTVLKKELVEMKGLLEYCVNLLQPKADEKEQELRLDADEVLVSLNRQKIWRVVSNIVNNAIKFSPQQSIINIKLQRKEASVILSVHDTGIGIPQEMQDKIFVTPAETARPGTSGEESYGLGLSIVQTIVKEHEGKLWFESTNGKGSVFYVELPCFN